MYLEVPSLWEDIPNSRVGWASYRYGPNYYFFCKLWSSHVLAVLLRALSDVVLACVDCVSSRSTAVHNPLRGGRQPPLLNIGGVRPGL